MGLSLKVGAKTYLLVAEKNDEVLHICAYEEEPTEADKASLRQELITNPKFGLVGVTDLNLAVVPIEDMSLAELEDEMKEGVMQC